VQFLTVCITISFYFNSQPAYLFYRKSAGKNGTDKDAGPSVRVKREADGDGGDEVVFGKKARHETVSANDLK